MYDCFFTFRSITHAQHGAAVLGRAGIWNQLARTPKSISERGCGYCVHVRARDCETAARLFQQANVQASALYRSDGDAGARRS